MVQFNSGLNRIRDLVYDDIDDGQLGTGTSAKADSDDAMETPDATTLKALITKSKSEKSIKYDYTLLATAGSDQTYTEFSLLRSTAPITVYGGNLFTGITFVNGGTKDLQFSKVHYFRGQ